MDSDSVSVEHFRRLHLSCPVTCLKLDSSKKFLFVCQGPNVSVFSKHSQSSRPWSQRRAIVNDVLPANRIHGAKVVRDHEDNDGGNDDADHIVFYGQKQFRLGRFRRLNSEVGSEIELMLNEKIVSAPDWLLEVRFLSTASQLALITAHNQLRCYDVTKIETQLVVDAPESHILYSASVIGGDWDSLVVAAGTVFNCVILWAPGVEEVVTLAGHDGVIFDIRYDSRLNLLVTASDDRSIRLWTLFPSSDSLSTTTLCSSTLPDVKPTLATTLYGHTARVWDVRFFDGSSKMASIGEDANLVVWDVAQRKIHSKFQVQRGKNLLSLEIAEDTVEGVGTLIVGGNDGGVRSYSVGIGDCGKEEVVANCTVENGYVDDDKALGNSNANDDATTKVVLFSKALSGDQAKAVCFLPQSRVILVLTSGGRILSFSSVADSSPIVIMDDPLFASYSVMAVSNQPNALFVIGNIHGVVRVICGCDENEANGNDQRSYRHFDVQVGDGKIQAIHFLPYILVDNQMLSDVDNDDNDQQIMLISLQNGGVLVASLDLSTFSLRTLMSVTLPYTKQRWVTAAVCFSIVERENEPKHLLVCGDRTGNVHLFDQSSPAPLKTFHKIHSKSGTTFMTVASQPTSSKTSFPFIRSLGRDGFTRSFQVVYGDSHAWDLEQTNACRVAKGFDWLEKMMSAHSSLDGDDEASDDTQLILGFHGDSFVAWDENRRQRCWTVPCGGGHRSWDFVVESPIPIDGAESKTDENPLLMRFASVSKGDVVVYERKYDEVNATSGDSIIEALHGKQITSVEVLWQSPKELIVATGCEDTTVIIWSVDLEANDTLGSSSTPHRVLSILSRHISSVRALTKVRIGTENYLISGGGRAQICCWKLALWDNNDDATSNKGDVNVSLLGDHRWNPSEKSRRKNAKKEANDDCSFLDLRYMALDARHVAEQGCLVTAAAGSDGFMRVFHLDLSTKKIIVSAVTPVEKSHKCLLGVKFLDDHDDRAQILCTSSTDGNLNVWKLTSIHLDDRDVYSAEEGRSSALTLMKCLKCHQSGFSCFDLRKRTVDDSRLFHCVSGGDDNAVGLTSISLKGGNLADGEVHENRRITIANAHATQVTSVYWIDGQTFVSVSIDQRVNVWRWKGDNQDSTNRCEMVASHFVNVADVAAAAWGKIDSTGRHFLVVVGIGVEVMELDLSWRTPILELKP